MRLGWTTRQRRIAIVASLALTGLGAGLLAAAHAVDSSYWQGLLLNVGTSLIVVVPLAVMGGILIRKVSDLQARVSLREAAEAAHHAIQERGHARLSKRIADLVEYRRRHVLQSNWQGRDPAEAVAQQVWLALGDVAAENLNAATGAGLEEQPWGDSYYVLQWVGESWRGLVRDGDTHIGFPLVGVAAYYRRGDFVAGAPHDGPPRPATSPQLGEDAYPAWRQSIFTYSRGTTVTVLVGHQLVDATRKSDDPWTRRLDLAVEDAAFGTKVGELAAEFRDEGARQLDRLAALLRNV